jgi:hypothetical protein
MAKCADDSAPPLNVQAVEDLLDTKNSGLIPTHVRYKNNKLFVSLDNEVAVAKAVDILNKKPEFQARFDTASKLNVLFPVVPLFVNVSDTVSLHRELEHRNQLLRNQIQSVKVIYTKPHTSEGQSKIFLRTRAARDSILLRGKASILGTNHRIVPVDLDREVRRCFKCQGYGHTQKFCPAATPACGRCAMPHQISDCVNPSALKCVKTAVALTALETNFVRSRSKRWHGTEPS